MKILRKFKKKILLFRTVPLSCANAGLYRVACLIGLVSIRKKKEPLTTVNVWLGKSNQVEVYTSDDIYKTIKKGQKKKLKIKVVYDGPVEAPISKDQELAKLRIVYDKSKPDGMKLTMLSNKRINKTGWRPKTKLELGLKKTYNYYRSLLKN